MEDIQRDAESFAAGPATTLGQWTPAQNIDHVRQLIRVSLDGSDIRLPLPLRATARLLKGYLLRAPFRPGIRTVPAFEPPADITLDEALAALRRDVARAGTPGAMCHRSPLLGRLSHTDWERLHCRHAELHFSFILPAGRS